MDTLDLHIIDDDLYLNQIGEPELVSDSLCVAQDIGHMLREKGYAFKMLGERSQISLASIATEIELEMELDERIYPGSAKVELTGEYLICSGRTIDNEVIEVML